MEFHWIPIHTLIGLTVINDYLCYYKDYLIPEIKKHI